MKILKFGGTSVSTKERIETICKTVSSQIDQDPVVVVSAVRGVTDLLLELIDARLSRREEIIKSIYKIHLQLISSYFGYVPKELNIYLKNKINEIHKLLKAKKGDQLKDNLVSFGEILSSYIISHALNSSGIKAEQVISTNIIITDNNFTNAEFIASKTRKQTNKTLLPLIKKNIVPVVTGFIGSTEDGLITTLGRGGSDYSASIIGFALDADEIEIWTDVDGIYSADPRIISQANLIPNITFKEASELAAFGARVLHPRSIRPAFKNNIPVRIKNTLNPFSKGTLVMEIDKMKGRVCAVASKNNVVLVNIYSTEMLLQRGFLEKIFKIFARHNISIDLVSVSEVSVSVTLDNNQNLEKAIIDLKKFTQVSYKKAGIVSLIGHNILNVKYIKRDIFTLLELANIPVRMISMGASEINISLVLEIEDVDLAVKILHTGLISKRTREEVLYT